MNVIDQLRQVALSVQSSASDMGVVTAIDSVNASLTIQTSAPEPVTGVRWLAHYTPTVNDFVVLMKAGNGWWVVGKNSKDLRTPNTAYGTVDLTVNAMWQGVEYVSDGLGDWTSISNSPQIGLFSEEPGLASMDRDYTFICRLAGDAVPTGAVIQSAKLQFSGQKSWDFGSKPIWFVSTHSYTGTPSWPATTTNEHTIEEYPFEAQPRVYSFDLPSAIATSLAAGTAKGIHIRASHDYGLFTVGDVRVILTYSISV